MALKDEYCTISEAANSMGVTRQTISRWITQGKLEGEKIGRETLIKNVDVFTLSMERFTEKLGKIVPPRLIEFLYEKGDADRSEKLQPIPNSFDILAKTSNGKIEIIEFKNWRIDFKGSSAFIEYDDIVRKPYKKKRKRKS